MPMRKSPYINNLGRLEDVVAAIQAMGAHPQARLGLDEWTERLRPPKSSQTWKTIFAEHPEFFVVWDPKGTSKPNAQLRWRHSYDKTYDPESKRELTAQKIKNLPQEDKQKLTGKPLTTDQIEALMKTAIELHGRGIADAQESRWLVPLLFGLLVAVVGITGTILGALLKVD